MRPRSLAAAVAFALAGSVASFYFLIVFATEIAGGDWWAYAWMIFWLVTAVAAWVAARDTLVRHRERNSATVR